MWLYIWIAVVVIAIIVEFCTSELVSVWFAGGGLIALILSAIPGVEYYYQLIAFVVVSALLFIFCRKPILKLISKDGIKTNAAAIIGKEYTLIDGISLGKTGSVKVSGLSWSAVGETENTAIEEGALVSVIEIKGNKLVVKEIKENVE